MKKATLLFILLCLCSFSSWGQSENATLYVIREPAHAGSAVPFFVFMDAQLLCKINNKSYSVHEVKPGNHAFQIQYAGKFNEKARGKLDFPLEAGKTYYIKVNPVARAVDGYLSLVEVTENTFNSLKAGLKVDEECL